MTPVLPTASITTVAGPPERPDRVGAVGIRVHDGLETELSQQLLAALVRFQDRGCGSQPPCR